MSGRTYDPDVAAAREIHRWSLEEYHRVVASGALDAAHVELIDGFLVDMSPRSPAHEDAVEWLTLVVSTALDTTRFRLRVGAALSIGASEPEPDLAVIPADVARPFHPATAALAIEVSHSSRRRDLEVKPHIYAQADIPRYWVIDLDRRRAVTHELPKPGGYARVETLPDGGALRAPELGVEIALSELLAFALR